MAKINISKKARRKGIPPNIVHNRMHKGWSLKRALETPVRVKRKSKTIKAIKVEKVDFPFTPPESKLFDDGYRNLIIGGLALVGIIGIAFIV
tara:strand:+ start:283 stop:558 length:276 start_codon:yes stop_codon:yes gene_type:complete